MMMWTKNLKTDEERTRFESTVRAARPVLERMAQLLSEEEVDITRTELSVDSYDNPNWSHKQAFKNGQRNILRKIQTLINLDQQKELNESTRRY